MISRFIHFAFIPVAIILCYRIFGARAYDVDKVVTSCLAEADKFARIEGNYPLISKLEGHQPTLVRPPIMELQSMVYKAEIQQRPFECIGLQLNSSRIPNKALRFSKRYRTLVDKCELGHPVPQCHPSRPYRSIDGTCNNLVNRRWGGSMTCSGRLLPANYEGVSGFRKSVQGGKSLPEARSISVRMFRDPTKQSEKNSALLVFFAQLLAHDVTEFASTFIKKHKLECCLAPAESQHPQCAPLPVETDDPFYSSHNVSCLNFFRYAMCDSCSIEKRSFINQPTSYIDCSFVYGLTDHMARELRTNDGTDYVMRMRVIFNRSQRSPDCGQLKTRVMEAGPMLPIDETLARKFCGDPEKGQFCVKAGDLRINSHSTLMMLHTVFAREHNRIARQLKNINPRWNDETLYQEARKILIAEFQVISFKELLPLLLGPDLMSKYRLQIGSGSRYSPSVDPSILVEFNVAAFRLHSLIPGKLFDHTCPESMLKNTFQNARPLYNLTKSFLTGMAFWPAMTYDKSMDRTVTDLVFMIPPPFYGFDLAAADIQRGRDSGLPTYTEVFNFIHKKRVTDFEDLRDYMDTACVDRLKKIYADVRDIDLWVGLNCERVPDSMLISPTAAEIIAEQFRRLKTGDRFFFEYNHFTDEQMETLQNASFAKLICDHIGADYLQPRVLQLPSVRNLPQPCSTIPEVNLKMWKTDEDEAKKYRMK